MDLTFEIEEQFNITKDAKEIRPLEVTENGKTYDAGENAAFNPVTVKVEGNKDLIDCESLPTEGVQEDKIYRVRWSETVDTDPDAMICITNGDGTLDVYDSFKLFWGADDVLVFVNSIDEIPSEPDENYAIGYLCNADGTIYFSQTEKLSDLMEYPSDSNVGFISSPDELDTAKIQIGIIKVGGGLVTNHYSQIGVPVIGENDEIIVYDNGSWEPLATIRKYIESVGVRYVFSQNPDIVTAVGLINYSDTSNVFSMYGMFWGCSALTEVPLFDTRNVGNMRQMFNGCSALTEVPLFDTRNVGDIEMMFQNCVALTEVPAFDFRKVSMASSAFYGCRSLTECWIKNIGCNLQVGSGMSYGHLLTVDSLVHLIYELRDTGSSRTLTVGSANLAKLQNVYVRLIDITDEMRAKDDLIDKKLPFEVCESTDEGACLIKDYVFYKNWEIQ